MSSEQQILRDKGIIANAVVEVQHFSDFSKELVFGVVAIAESRDHVMVSGYVEDENTGILKSRVGFVRAEALRVIRDPLEQQKIRQTMQRLRT